MGKLFERIERVVIAVKDLEQAANFFSDIFDMEFEYPGADAKGLGMAVAYSHLGLELTSATDPDTTIGRYIQKRGEGLWAIVVKVSDMDEAVKKLTEKGLHRVGMEINNGYLHEIAFHPKDAHGVQIILVDYPERSPASYAALSLMEKIPLIGKKTG